MTTGRTPAETRLDLEDIEEQGIPPGRHTAEGLLEEVVEVEAEEPAQEEDSTHSDTRSLVKNRDPRGVNKYLKVTFEDVIAEPPSVRSFDKVWLWSHALFEVSRLWCYRLISLLLAVPVSLVAGILFAVFSCLHIWLIMPFIQLFLINMHWVQTVWGSVLDIAIAPFFKSMGKCCSRINVRLARD
ncbi:caveolin-2 [Salvelinus sp. IW2-2015]|uniref:caveolin-2 n=1 Tax=Salvelinus sp. IW2-2015 TaxID=2691554 RepID=UPI000CDF6247|nr:caveolin-2 [Salvelinus alpinus]